MLKWMFASVYRDIGIYAHMLDMLHMCFENLYKLIPNRVGKF